MGNGSSKPYNPSSRSSNKNGQGNKHQPSSDAPTNYSKSSDNDDVNIKSSSSSGSKKPTNQEEAIRKFKESIQDWCNDGKLPALKCPCPWKIYKWSAGNLAHHSIVIGTETKGYGQDQGFITLELYVNQSGPDDNDSFVYPDTSFINKDKGANYILEEKWKHYKEIDNLNTSLFMLQKLSINLIYTHGEYNPLANNCQDFANAFIMACKDPEKFINGHNTFLHHSKAGLLLVAGVVSGLALSTGIGGGIASSIGAAIIATEYAVLIGFGTGSVVCCLFVNRAAKKLSKNEYDKVKLEKGQILDIDPTLIDNNNNINNNKITDYDDLESSEEKENIEKEITRRDGIFAAILSLYNNKNNKNLSFGGMTEEEFNKFLNETKQNINNDDINKFGIKSIEFIGCMERKETFDDLNDNKEDEKETDDEKQKKRNRLSSIKSVRSVRSVGSPTEEDKLVHWIEVKSNEGDIWWINRSPSQLKRLYYKLKEYNVDTNIILNDNDFYIYGKNQGITGDNNTKFPFGSGSISGSISNGSLGSFDFSDRSSVRHDSNVIGKYIKKLNNYFSELWIKLLNQRADRTEYFIFQQFLIHGKIDDTVEIKDKIAELRSGLKNDIPSPPSPDSPDSPDSPPPN